MTPESAVTIITQVGLPTFLILYYLFVELPARRKSDAKLTEALNGLASQIKKSDDLEKDVKVFKEIHKRNFVVYAAACLENVGFLIRDKIFDVIEKNHVEENRETIEKDIETEVEIRVNSCARCLEEFGLEEIEKVAEHTKELGKEITCEVKKIVFAKNSEPIKKRQTEILMKNKTSEGMKRIQEAL